MISRSLLFLSLSSSPLVVAGLLIIVKRALLLFASIKPPHTWMKMNVEEKTMSRRTEKQTRKIRESFHHFNRQKKTEKTASFLPSTHQNGMHFAFTITTFSGLAVCSNYFFSSAFCDANFVCVSKPGKCYGKKKTFKPNSCSISPLCFDLRKTLKHRIIVTIFGGVCEEECLNVFCVHSSKVRILLLLLSLLQKTKSHYNVQSQRGWVEPRLADGRRTQRDDNEREN